ncbi:hypothetical protein R6Q59_011271 [Mikania micrantha]
MREGHHEIQTPKKEHLSVPSNRKAKFINVSSKKLNHQQHKSINLSSVITPITEGDAILNLSEGSNEKISSISVAVDVDQSTLDINKTNIISDQLPEEPIRISPISEAFVFEEDQPSIESYIASLNQHISPSFLTSASVEGTPLSSNSPAVSTPLSSITNVEITPSSSTSVLAAYGAAIHGDTTEEAKSVKLELLVKHLRESMFQVLHSSDIEPNHKKLLDALVKMAIEEFCILHEERGSVAEWFSNKVKLLLLSYLLLMLLVSAGFFFLSDAQSSYYGPPPT